MTGPSPILPFSAFALLLAAPMTSAALAQSAESDFDEAFDQIAPSNLPLAPEEGAVDISRITPKISSGGAVIRELGTGTASYYGRRFHGRRTANGERFDMHAYTAAHRTLPFGSLVRVTNPNNGRSVTVRINDRGPFIRNRVIDLSRAAAEQIGMIRAGHARVHLSLVAS